MGQSIGQSLPIAVCVALSPLPIVAVVLLLVTPAARANGPAFVLGWWVGLGVVGALVLSIAAGSGREVRRRDAADPDCMGALDRFTPLKAAGAGVECGRPAATART